MKCLCSGEHMEVDDVVPSSDYLAKGRHEYQKGNIEAALHVFEGIDIAAVSQKMKATLAGRAVSHKRWSRSFARPSMSIQAVSFLLEAMLLKAKSLQRLGRYIGAAQSCELILDIVESSSPSGLPENLGADYKLQETLIRAVKLLPELWKLAESPRDAILSYRRALLHQWNLDSISAANIQRDFAIFLLYSGCEANCPNVNSQMDSFIPRNNVEEAILLLMILLSKVIVQKIEWDPSILNHLTYALSISGGLRALAHQIEALLPGIINRKERYQTLALCYYGEKDSITSLRLLKKLLSSQEDPNCILALLLASRICGDSNDLSEEGINFANRAIENSHGKCDDIVGAANFLLGFSLSAKSRSAMTESERVRRQADALQSLETARILTKMSDPKVLYYLSLENADQRKLDAALYHAKCLLALEGDSNSEGWVLLPRILSAQKRFEDAKSIVDVALDHTEKWEQGKLLQIKAKIQIAQGEFKKGIETYTQLIAAVQVQNKSFCFQKKLGKDSGKHNKVLEVETWHNLASIYIKLSQWHDAEICLSKSKAIAHYSAPRLHVTGLLHEARGLYQEALCDFLCALDIDPTHVQSLVSIAILLRKLGSKPLAIPKSFLMEALRLDRMNALAWYNLGLLYKAEGTALVAQAAECFQAATFLEETSPIEPFR